MTTETFRSAVQGDIEAWRLASFPEVPAYFENGPLPDEAAIGSIWLDVNIRWYGGKFVSMGLSPMGRDTGTVSTNVFCRIGSGTAQSDQILDSLAAHLRARRLGGAVLYKPHRTISTDFRGWAKNGILVPFTLDS